MAATGTITGVYDNNGNLAITITGITQASNSPSFTLKASIYTSFGVAGTFAGTSLQWQGSNDGGTTWDNIGLPVTVAGGGTLTPGQVFYSLYQAVLTGGGATTSLNVNVIATIPR